MTEKQRQPSTKPAEAFPVAAILLDEIAARGITLDRVAMGMCEQAEDYGVQRVTLDFIVACSHDPHMHLGWETAHALERALGVSAELWMKTDKIYRDWLVGGGKPWEYDGDIEALLSDLGPPEAC